MSRAPVDAIVVLGCRVRPGGAPSGALARRARLGARAFRAGAAPLVVASGGRSWEHELEAIAIRRLLVAEGVPDSSILLELRSRTTLENARYSAELLGARGKTRVLLASCVWHLPRALAAFRRAGLSAEPPPPDWFEPNEPPPGSWWRERVLGWADRLRWQVQGP